MLSRILALSLLLFIGSETLAAEKLQPCKMTLQKTLNANDPDKKMEHMTMLDNNRRLDFFFGAHQDPNKTPIADAYSKVGEPKKLLKYVKNSLEDKKNEYLHQRWRSHYAP